MKAQAIAPANLAFIKYWGNANDQLRIPNTGSLSMNLSGFETSTSVTFDQDLTDDEIQIDGEIMLGKAKQRVSVFLDNVRQMANISTKAQVVSNNSFPKGTGIASSASAFAALAVAASTAAGLTLSPQELSQLARLGSGSACRSIPDGFVEWLPGDSHETSYAVSLHAADYWDVVDVVAIVSEEHKKVGSTEGHAMADTSPFYRQRVLAMPDKIAALKKAIEEKDFTTFGEISESETLNMHAIMMTSNPSLLYWAPGTIDLMKQVMQWREEGLESYFSLDAGPNVHILCLGKDASAIEQRVKQSSFVSKVFIAHPANGAHLI